MMKKFTVLLAFLLLTSCAKGVTPIKSNERDSDTELNKNFDYAPISEIGQYGDSRYEHLTVDENACNNSSEDVLYDFNVKINGGNLEHLDDIGEIFLGEDYNSDNWTLQNFDYGTEESPTQYTTATYTDLDCQLVCDGGSIIYLSGDKTYNAQLIPPDSYEEDYPENQAKKAEDTINRLYDALGKTAPQFYGAVYLQDSNTWEYDFRQNVKGLTVTDVAFRVNDLSGNIKSDEFANISFYGKCSVFLNENEDLSVYITQYYLTDTKINKEYDTAITLNSALDFMDKNIAEYSSYTVKSAQLQYMLVMQEDENLGKSNSYALNAVPVWVFEMISSSENQRYCCVINAISGDYSFVKVKGDSN